MKFKTFLQDLPKEIIKSKNFKGLENERVIFKTVRTLILLSKHLISKLALLILSAQYFVKMECES
jgi:hypothetical protein